MSSTTSSTRSQKKAKGKKWDALPLPSDEELALPSSQLYETRLPYGYTLRFFPHDMRHMYTAPSKHIRLSQGVVDYVREHNQQGPSKSKAKLYLCTMFERSGSCENGYMCREVHCDLKVADAKLRSLVQPAVIRPAAVLDEETNPLFDSASATNVPAEVDVLESSTTNSEISSTASSCASSTVSKAALALVDPDDDEVACSAVHMRNAPEDAHPRLPPGVTYRLALPNMQSPIDEIPSEKVFVTKGAQDYYDQVMNQEAPTMNMQHCAHFSKNGMCCFGSDCQFVHVAQYRRTCGMETDSSGGDSGGEGRGSRRDSNKGSDHGSRSSSTSSKGKGAKAQRKGTQAATDANPLSVSEALKSIVIGHTLQAAAVSGAAAVPSTGTTLNFSNAQQQQMFFAAPGAALPMQPPLYSFGQPPQGPGAAPFVQAVNAEAFHAAAVAAAAGVLPNAPPSYSSTGLNSPPPPPPNGFASHQGQDLSLQAQQQQAAAAQQALFFASQQHQYQQQLAQQLSSGNMFAANNVTAMQHQHGANAAAQQPSLWMHPQMLAQHNAAHVQGTLPQQQQVYFIVPPGAAGQTPQGMQSLAQQQQLLQQQQQQLQQQYFMLQNGQLQQAPPRGNQGGQPSLPMFAGQQQQHQQFTAPNNGGGMQFVHMQQPQQPNPNNNISNTTGGGGGMNQQQQRPIFFAAGGQQQQQQQQPSSQSPAQMPFSGTPGTFLPPGSHNPWN